MSARVFLHIGSPKTGTTFLQQVFWSQRDIVRGQGVLLPGRAFNDHFLACTDLRGRHDEVPLSVGAWARLVEEISAWDGDALISHELFAGVEEEGIETAVSDLAEVCDEVHVTITARDLARQIPAEWQEHLKHRSTLRFEEFVSSVRKRGKRAGWFWTVQDVPELVARWAPHVGVQRVHVVTVPSSGAGPDVLWGRFARTVGLEPGEFSLEVGHTNSSVGLEQAEMLRRLNEELGDRLTRQGAYPVLVKDQLVHQMLALRPGTKIELTKDDWQFAVDYGHEVKARLAELGVDVVGDLDELVPHGDPPTRDSQPEIRIEQVLDEAMAGLASTLSAHDDTRVQLRRAREAAGAAAAPPIDPEVNPVRRGLVAMSRRWNWADSAKRFYKRKRQRADEEPPGG